MHVRAIITWLAIFPLAVYVVVPRLLAFHQRLRSKR
jgi:hypothetical protein